MKTVNCRICGWKTRKTFVDLGHTPLSNSYLKKNMIKNEKKFPLHALICTKCMLVQLEKFENVWGKSLKAGLAKRQSGLKQLDISAGGMLHIDESLTPQKQKEVLDFARPSYALYVGGMGARGKNFYNDMCRDYGYEKEAVEIQDLYLDGKKKEAAVAIPGEWLELSNLVGPRGYIKERLGAFKEAGVTVLQVNPVGPDPVREIETLRSILDES